jgi:P3 major capsid protein
MSAVGARSGAAATPGSNPANNVQAANRAFRNAVVRNAIKIVQPLQTLSINPAQQTTVNFLPRNVGLLLGFYIMVSFNVKFSGEGGAAGDLWEFGAANVLSNITFSDFNNYQRINCSGRYLNLVDTVKNRRPFASALTLNAYPINYSNNFQVITAASATTDADTLVQMLYYVPISYSDWDLRGAIYSAVTGGQMNLQVTFNANNIFSADALNGVYSAGTGNAIDGNVTLDVYQVFYDQLPTTTQNGQTKVVVPPVDLSTTYELHETTAGQIAQGVENTIAFSNYREFLSTTAIYYDTDGGANTLAAQADISYWALQAANLLYIFRMEPFLAAAQTRKEIGMDMPDGTYYFSTREKPINTQQWGNMNLVINPTNNYTGDGQVAVGYETFAQQNVVLGAQAFANVG